VKRKYGGVGANMVKLNHGKQENRRETGKRRRGPSTPQIAVEKNDEKLGMTTVILGGKKKGVRPA